jgi:hypothetical protein
MAQTVPRDTRGIMKEVLVTTRIQTVFQTQMMTPVAFIIAAVLWLASPANADIGVAAGSAYYTGPISAEQNQRLFKAVHGEGVTRLVIISTGGDVEAGIALGLWVFDHRLDVVVPEYCLSSCANYVFPAGRHKSIGAGAVVAWHGNYNHLKQTGLWQDDIAARMERHGEDAVTARRQVREEMERLVGLERDFFTHIGVDEYLCWIGKMPPHNAPNYYFLSRQDMARFGVNRVQAPSDYTETDISDFNVNIKFIVLSEND